MSTLGPSVLIVNPAAARSRGRLIERIIDVLTPFGLHEIRETQGPGDAARVAAEAVDSGARVLVTVGGDGTVTQVAEVAAERGVVIVPVPAGGANIFARALGWPTSSAAAAQALAPAMAAGVVRNVTVGSVLAGAERRPFIANAGIGLDADVVEWVETRPGIKSRIGQAAFGLGMTVAVSRALRDAPRLSIRANGAPEMTAAALAVAAGSPYTFLGRLPVHMLPPAGFDGSLAWLSLPNITPASLIQLAAGSLGGKRRHLASGRMAAGHARAIRVVSDRPVAVQADGEPLGVHRAAVFETGPTLSVLVPPGPSALAAPLKSAG